MTWLLLRPRPGAPLEVELDDFVTHGQILGRFSSRPEAVEARERQEQMAEREALREQGQGELFS